jgi:quinoprotein glucose dehydrogenase
VRFGPPDPATLERGKAAYEEACAMCHGADRAGTPAAPSLLNVGGQINGPQFRRIVTYGNGRMPPLPHVSDQQIGDILAYLGGAARPRFARDMPVPDKPPEGPVAAMGGITRPPLPPAAADAQPRAADSYPEGLEVPARRYFTDYGLGHPYLLGPPWSQIIAYDLNRGVIKWRKPLGQDRDATQEGGKGDGLPRGSQRMGMIITSTGLVFSTARDGVLYAYDAENGDILWSYELPMVAEGLPSAFQWKGRTYLVVNATTPHTWGLNSRESGIGSPERMGQGGYVVFALPEKQKRGR